MTAPEDWEDFLAETDKLFARAIDEMVEGQTATAEPLVETGIARVRSRLESAADPAERLNLLLLWASGLEILDEKTLALLKLQEAIEEYPDNEEALWRTASLLLEESKELEVVVEILEKRLIPRNPLPEYIEALGWARASLGLRSDGTPVVSSENCAGFSADDEPEGRPS